MSLQFARKAAERIVENSSRQTLPIDPKDIALEHRVPVFEEALEDGVSGLLVTNGNRSTIFVNKSDSIQRRRFSIAHELGHFILRHHSKQGDHVHVDRGVKVLQRNLKSSAGVDPAEIEANQFAAALLMPAHLLRSAIETVSKGKALDEVMVETLASKDFFHVSEQAMTIRLERLGFL